jgi:hypothetical protein
MTAAAEYQALICMTTCRRLHHLRAYLPHFAAFTAADPRFSLLVALDGDEAETLDFCREWGVPLVYSDEREGVGISKNRVLERFPDYDYYFFLDDDVELVDGSVFPAHVDLARETGIQHFSLFARDGVRKRTGETPVHGGTIVHGLFGGGQFNFYTGPGLKQVGGWHPRFAEYRRWGHTEHSYRFWRAGLAPAPFNVAEFLADTCIWHAPPPATQPPEVATDEDQIPVAERELIDQELRNVPLQTLAPHHFNGVPFGDERRLAATLAGGERYPIVDSTARRHCRSGFELWRFETGAGALGRARAFASAAANWPGNPALRHIVKTSLGR